MSVSEQSNPPVLVVAHPGHEVTLHGWLARTRAVVCVLTDGSGQFGFPRLASTSEVLAGAGARRGPVYGRLTDAEVYAALLARDARALAGVARELAKWLVRNPPAYVVTDAAEGYNPAHDLCRALSGVAVELAGRASGHPLPLHEYVVAGDRAPCLARRCDGAAWWRLADDALERKWRAASRYTELATEVRGAIERNGVEGYRVECLHAAQPRGGWTCPAGEAPHYERHGQARVAAGKYGHVIRHREHVAPLTAALWALAR